ncbi:hypothetical protein ERJ75_001761900 [Trypanosoma vivax]|nr:hypothetical protein ERJ75_001761900 [Trypanosoma vivax]
MLANQHGFTASGARARADSISIKEIKAWARHLLPSLTAARAATHPLPWRSRAQTKAAFYAAPPATGDETLCASGASPCPAPHKRACRSCFLSPVNGNAPTARTARKGAGVASGVVRRRWAAYRMSASGRMRAGSREKGTALSAIVATGAGRSQHAFGHSLLYCLRGVGKAQRDALPRQKCLHTVSPASLGDSALIGVRIKTPNVGVFNMKRGDAMAAF